MLLVMHTDKIPHVKYELQPVFVWLPFQKNSVDLCKEQTL
jgi:hypothetical protein